MLRELGEREQMVMAAVIASFKSFAVGDWEKLNMTMVDVQVRMPLMLVATVKKVMNREPEEFAKDCIQMALDDFAKTLAEKYLTPEKFESLLGKVMDETKEVREGNFREAEASVIKKMLKGGS
jgi:hypothetical protein